MQRRLRFNIDIYHFKSQNKQIYLPVKRSGQEPSQMEKLYYITTMVVITLSQANKYYRTPHYIRPSEHYGSAIFVSHFTLCLLVSPAVYLCKTRAANSLQPDQARQMSGLIWIQAISYYDGIPERIFKNVNFYQNQQTTKMDLPSMQRVNKFPDNDFS